MRFLSILECGAYEPDLGVKWLSSLYVDGKSTKLALSAPEGWTMPRRPEHTQTGLVVFAETLREAARDILESIRKERRVILD